MTPAQPARGGAIRSSILAEEQKKKFKEEKYDKAALKTPSKSRKPRGALERALNKKGAESEDVEDKKSKRN